MEIWYPLEDVEGQRTNPTTEGIWMFLLDKLFTFSASMQALVTKLFILSGVQSLLESLTIAEFSCN